MADKLALSQKLKFHKILILPALPLSYTFINHSPVSPPLFLSHLISLPSSPLGHYVKHYPNQGKLLRFCLFPLFLILLDWIINRNFLLIYTSEQFVLFVFTFISWIVCLRYGIVELNSLFSIVSVLVLLLYFPFVLVIFFALPPYLKLHIWKEFQLWFGWE